MNKIPTLYVRDPETHKVTDQVTPGCEWVLDGRGIATRKFDGTCVLLDTNGNWWARREVKPGKTPPPNYQLVSIDPNTGKSMGWEPIEQSAFAKFHAEAALRSGASVGGTYELIGPKINGNPEGVERHELVPHGKDELDQHPDGPKALIDSCCERGWEGVVWYGPGGARAKLKVRDLLS